MIGIEDVPLMDRVYRQTSTGRKLITAGIVLARDGGQHVRIHPADSFDSTDMLPLRDMIRGIASGEYVLTGHKPTQARSEGLR